MRSSVGASRGWLAVFAVVALLLGGCAGSRGGPISYDVQDFNRPDAARPAVLPDNYQLAPGDKLDINVFRVEDLSGEYTVDLAGNLAFPLVGTISAIGLTTSELAGTIESRLSQNYLQDPDVTVGITASTGRFVTIDGSVRQPGAFPVTSSLTLVEAVAMARGTDEFANPRRVAIFRRIDGQRMAAAFDLTSIRRGEMPDPDVYPGDIIYVDGSQARRALRDIFGALPILALFRPY